VTQSCAASGSIHAGHPFLIADRPSHAHAYRWLAAALGQLGRTDEARAVLDKVIETAPAAFRQYAEQRPPWMAQADYDHMLEGLHKAGWQRPSVIQA
jgi:adenylate cyclase